MEEVQNLQEQLDLVTAEKDKHDVARSLANKAVAALQLAGCHEIWALNNGFEQEKLKHQEEIEKLKLEHEIELSKLSQSITVTKITLEEINKTLPKAREQRDSQKALYETKANDYETKLESERYKSKTTTYNLLERKFSKLSERFQDMIKRSAAADRKVKYLELEEAKKRLHMEERIRLQSSLDTFLLDQLHDMGEKLKLVEAFVEKLTNEKTAAEVKLRESDAEVEKLKESMAELSTEKTAAEEELGKTVAKMEELTKARNVFRGAWEEEDEAEQE